MPAVAPLQVTVVLWPHGARPEERIWRLCQRISVGGLEFAGELPYDEGRPLELSFELPEAQSWRTLTASARPLQPPGQGEIARVAFIGLADETREYIENYVKERNAS